MRYIKQFLIILAFSLVAEVLAFFIDLPIPASIYGFALLFLALCTGLLKPQAIADTAHFLISIMGIFFVAPAVNLLTCWDIIAPSLAPILIIIICSNILVFGVAGLVTQALRRKEESHG